MHFPTRLARLPHVFAVAACLATVLALLQAPAEAAAQRVTISGKVTSPDPDHAGLPSVEVCALRHDKAGKYRTRYCQDTTASGRYSMSVPAANYSFEARSSSLYGEWVPQKWGDGKLIRVGASRSVNFQMVRGATISGELRMSDDSALGENSLSIGAYRVLSTGRILKDRTSFSNVGPTGHYQVSQLPRGTYALLVEDNGPEPLLARQWFPDAATAKTSTSVTVATAQASTGHDMALSPGSQLKFTIENARGMATGGQAQLYDADGREIFSRQSISSGTVKFTGLHPGTYRARASTAEVVFHQWYSRKKSFATANPISVGRGVTVARTFSIKYPQLKLAKRPKMTNDGYVLRVTHGKWNKSTRAHSVAWYRDGKLIRGASSTIYWTQKADRGHRIKACVTGRRTGYPDARACSTYSKKITQY